MTSRPLGGNSKAWYPNAKNRSSQQKQTMLGNLDFGGQNIGFGADDFPQSSYANAVKKTKKSKRSETLGLVGTTAKKIKTTPQDEEQWPTPLKAYVARTFERSTPVTRPKLEQKLKLIVGHAQRTNTLWSIDWDKVELPDPRTSEESIPLLVQKVPAAFTAIPTESAQKKKVKKSMIPVLGSPSTATVAKNTKKPSIDTSDLNHLPPHQRAAEIARREERRNRFEAEKMEMQAKLKKRQVFQPVQPRFDGNPDAVDWNETTIVGTCAELEKPYLRLTSAPDPSTVRPLSILQKTLAMLQQKWKHDQNYTYTCDQMKSLRQDLTVQRIKNEFTVKVYETHARIALEMGDLGEFNQCSTQLRQLYTLHELPGCEDEFTAYRILYLIHTLNGHDLIELIGSITRPGPAVQHAFHVRSAISCGDYVKFFLLYHEAPNMSGYLMDNFIERERLKTLLKLTRAYRPSMTVEFVARTLGYVATTESVQQEELKEVAEWLTEIGLTITEQGIDSKAAVPILAERVAELGAKGVDIKGQIH